MTLITEKKGLPSVLKLRADCLFFHKINKVLAVPTRTLLLPLMLDNIKIVLGGIVLILFLFLEEYTYLERKKGLVFHLSLGD